MQNKIQTYLPLFSGFYNTLFEPCLEGAIERDIEYYEVEENRTLDGDDFNFDNNKYQQDASKAITELTRDFLRENINLPDCVKFEFNKLDSPMFYNFVNDRIYINVIIEDCKVFSTWLQEKIIEDELEIEEFLKENFTTRSGFISFYPNNLHDLRNLTDNFDDFSDFNTLGIILGALTYKFDEDYHSEVSDRLSECVYISEYLSIEE